MSKKILTFGEVMMRISPWSKENRILQTDNFKIEPGGSESNVAINLANLGNDTEFITKLPDNVVGNKIIRYLNKYGVKTNNIIRGGNRLGVYWTEHGVGPRASDVTYDRENSSITNLRVDEFNYSKLLDNVDWFHSSGITPALNKNSMKTLNKLLDEANKNNIKTSIDLNYRSKLWNWLNESDFQLTDIMETIASKCTMLIGNESDFQKMLNVNDNSNSDKEKYYHIARKIFNRFDKLEYMAVSLRDSVSASENNWSGLLFVKQDNNIKTYVSQKYQLKNIVDRVGGGDSFSSGIIHSLLNYDSYQKTVDFAIGFSALKHTIRGDIAEFGIEDVEHLLKTKGSGRIVR